MTAAARVAGTVTDLLRHAGAVAAAERGQVHVVDVRAVRDAVGDRWARQGAMVEDFVIRAFRRTGRDDDFIVRVNDTEFVLIQPRQGVGRGLLYFLFRDPTVRQILSGMVTGTSKSHQRISPPALLQTTLLAGEGAAFEAFEGIAEPILKRVLSLRAENRALAETRDYLLPRLMSGAVQVENPPARSGLNSPSNCSSTPDPGAV